MTIKRIHPLAVVFAAFLSFMLLVGAGGCSGDPNVEGAKMNLKEKDYAAAIENINTALETNPQNAEAYLIMGNVLNAQANENVNDADQHLQTIMEMVEAYDQASALDSTLSSEIAGKLALSWNFEYNKGVDKTNEATQTGVTEDYYVAAKYFQAAGIVDPNNLGSFRYHAIALLQGGATTDAIGPLEVAIAKGDTMPELRNYLAQIYHQEERYDDAIDILEQARTDYPDSLGFIPQLMNAYLQAGKTDEARSFAGAEVERDPENKVNQYTYGTLLLNIEDYDNAIIHLSKAIEIDPYYIDAVYNLGASYQNKAAGMKDAIDAIDDDIRDNGDSDGKKQAEVDAMRAEQKATFEAAIAPLEQAKMLNLSEGNDIKSICFALMQAHFRVGNNDKGQENAECAEIDTN